jgi:hypothetical protein
VSGWGPVFDRIAAAHEKFGQPQNAAAARRTAAKARAGRMTFEFPTADAAGEFFERVEGEAKISHRVVDLEHADDEATTLALAHELGGREA